MPPVLLLLTYVRTYVHRPASHSNRSSYITLLFSVSGGRAFFLSPPSFAAVVARAGPFVITDLSSERVATYYVRGGENQFRARACE